MSYFCYFFKQNKNLDFSRFLSSVYFITPYTISGASGFLFAEKPLAHPCALCFSPPSVNDKGTASPLRHFSLPSLHPFRWNALSSPASPRRQKPRMLRGSSHPPLADISQISGADLFHIDPKGQYFTSIADRYFIFLHCFRPFSTSIVLAPILFL